MFSRIMIVSVLIGFWSCGVAQCQQAPSADTVPAAAANTTPAAAPVQKLVLKEGADVQLKFAQDVTSKTATEGDTVNLVLDQDLKVGGCRRSESRRKSRWHDFSFEKSRNDGTEYLLLDDGRLKLRGSKGREGEGKEGAAVALTVLFGPIGLIKHGKNVEIKQGTPLAVYTDENYTIPTAK